MIMADIVINWKDIINEIYIWYDNCKIKKNRKDNKINPVFYLIIIC